MDVLSGVRNNETPVKSENSVYFQEIGAVRNRPYRLFEVLNKQGDEVPPTALLAG